jgi:hypothetical protein
MYGLLWRSQLNLTDGGEFDGSDSYYDMNGNTSRAGDGYGVAGTAVPSQGWGYAGPNTSSRCAHTN